MPVNLSAPHVFSTSRNFILSGFLFFISIALIYLFLSISYSSYFGSLLYGNDFWFGGDLSRHIYWSIDPDKSFRSHLHPFSFLLFKGQGWLLNFLNIAPNNSLIPVLSFSIIFYTSLVIIICTQLIVPLKKFPLWIQIAVIFIFLLIGPTLVFAPVPESHVLGGVSLLMQAILIWLWMQQKESGEFNIPEKRAISGGIILFALLATGFTLSNLMPALIMMLAIPAFRRIIFKIALLGGVFLILVILIHKLMFNFPFITRTISNIMKETAWMIIPGFSSLILSVNNLFLAQFGLSLMPELQVWTSGSGAEYYLEQSGPTAFQLLAMTLYMGGVVWNIKIKNNFKPDLKFFIFCALSLFSLIGFHSIYATGESYIFSAHAWPYVVLPGVITLRNSFLKKNYWSIILIITAVVVSMVQMLIGLNQLLTIQQPQA